ncbi:MAG: cytochrome c [Gammaproteobacteria bacterium]|nr:cytochrome c [Gammaproteobacteria bacterium]MDH4314365.1 cytochrome c [Gammaproteobacteria bacterium]MDH5214203.1 cytochrome c [Gammaproteobacteria bacterium]MDH5499505.1 cytochrome c [Gammaproteobacteria bacterium]
MSMYRKLLVAVTIVAGNVFAGDSPNLGEAVTAAEIAVADYTVLPNGDGLPTGSGNAKNGAAVYAKHCLACHGDEGRDGLNDRLAGGHGTLLTDNPVRTVGSYWPYATTLFDYVRRAMPYTTPGSLTNDEIYAVAAYILFLNGLVAEDTNINSETLPSIKMPNSDKIVWQYRPE